MKIVSGKFGGRKLYVPKNRDIRPTSDKIRGAVFNMLQSRGALDGANVLDAFCGTGALGLEALSRGAEHCTFLDKTRVSLDLAKDNAEMLGVNEICDFFLKDSSKIGNLPGDKSPYDLIFLDPPYAKGLVPITLNALINGGWVRSGPQGSWIVCETDKTFSYAAINGFVLDDEKIYGETKITLLSTDHTGIK